MALPVYTSRNVVVTWAGAALKGLAPDDFVTFNLANPITETESGADGKVSISYLPDETGTCTISCQQNGPANWVLSGVLAAQKASRTLAVGTIVIADPSGSVLAEIVNAHIQESPEISLGSSAAGNTFDWVFFCEEVRFLAVSESAASEIVDSDKANITALVSTILNA